MTKRKASQSPLALERAVARSLLQLSSQASWTQKLIPGTVGHETVTTSLPLERDVVCPPKRRQFLQCASPGERFTDTSGEAPIHHSLVIGIQRIFIPDEGPDSWSRITSHTDADGSEAAIEDVIDTGDPGEEWTGAAPPFNVGYGYFPITMQWRVIRRGVDGSIVGKGAAIDFPTTLQEDEIVDEDGLCVSSKGGTIVTMTLSGHCFATFNGRRVAI